MRCFFTNTPGLSRRLAIAGLATIPIILPTILLNFHDETYFNQHHAIIAHLQNGAYPPRYLYEPGSLLRYHYGFDLAAAIVTGLLRIRVDQAIDLLTLALWPLMFLLLWRLGEHFGGAKAGLFVSLMVCFAGGWPLSPDLDPCARAVRPTGSRLIPHSFLTIFSILGA